MASQLMAWIDAIHLHLITGNRLHLDTQFRSSFENSHVSLEKFTRQHIHSVV
jgi:hypothetical protein